MVSLTADMSPLHPDRNLALELVRATEAAAIRAVPFIGRGDKLAADGAAVDAMRAFFTTVNFDGTIVIGEGEKDEAPMLFNGEKVGNGRGPAVRCRGRPDRRHVADRRRPPERALGDRGVRSRHMLDASTVFYMDKLVTGPAGVGVVDIRLPIGENIRLLSKALDKPIDEMVVSVLNRPRHEQLIADIRAAGAGTRLMSDGDVAGGINAARHNARTDMCVGVGGSPEGIVTACAIKALGGHIQGILWPRDDDEKQKGADHGLKTDGYVYEADELVTGSNTIFVATGVTDGQLVAGVRREGDFIYSESVVLRGALGHAAPHRLGAPHLEVALGLQIDGVDASASPDVAAVTGVAVVTES